MLNHKPISILLSTETGHPGLFSFLTYLHAMPHVKVESSNEVLMSMPSGVDVLMTIGPERWSEAKLEIEKFVSTGGVWFHLLEASEMEIQDVEPSGSTKRFYRARLVD